MASKNQVAGRAKVRINGALLETAGDTVLELGGSSREPVEGDYEGGAFKRGTVKPAKLEVNVLNKKSFSAVAFYNIEDATVSVEFDNGKSYVIRGAYAEDAPPMTTSDGKAKGVLYGKPAEELR
jgi:hypothetical protein